MPIDFEKFNKAYESNKNELSKYSTGSGDNSEINLCIAKDSKNGKIKRTLGRAVLIPILDKEYNFIHAIKGYSEEWLPIPNKDHLDDPNNPDIDPVLYTKVVYVKDESYSIPLTDTDKELNAKLFELMQEYHWEFNSTYSDDVKVSNKFYFRGLLQYIRTDNGLIHDSRKTVPSTLVHTSSNFPKAYLAMCNDFDQEYGSKWKEKLFFGDKDNPGVFRDFLTITTEKSDAIGYNVNMNMMSIDPIKIPMEEFEKFRDFDVRTIGYDTTKFDTEKVKKLIEDVRKGLDLLYKQQDGTLYSTTQSDKPNLNEDLVI